MFFCFATPDKKFDLIDSDITYVKLATDLVKTAKVFHKDILFTVMGFGLTWPDIKQLEEAGARVINYAAFKDDKEKWGMFATYLPWALRETEKWLITFGADCIVRKPLDDLIAIGERDTPVFGVLHRPTMPPRARFNTGTMVMNKGAMPLMDAWLPIYKELCKQKNWMHIDEQRAIFEATQKVGGIELVDTGIMYNDMDLIPNSYVWHGQRWVQGGKWEDEVKDILAKKDES